MSHPTIINREECVLVVVDIQEKLLPAISGNENIVTKTLQLVKGAAELKIPIVVSEQYPKGLGSTIETLKSEIDNAEKAGCVVKYIEKTTFSCTNCDAFLDELGVLSRDQIILCGIESHICVSQTALGLVEEGYMPFVVADAVGSRDDANKQLALDRLRQADVVILPVESVLYEALVDSKTSGFKEICNIIK